MLLCLFTAQLYWRVSTSTAQDELQEQLAGTSKGLDISYYSRIYIWERI